MLLDRPGYLKIISDRSKHSRIVGLPDAWPEKEVHLFDLESPADEKGRLEKILRFTLWRSLWSARGFRRFR